MANITLKTRIQNKYKTFEEWDQEKDFIPLKGEICYASNEDTIYQKIGDGITNFQNLPWMFSHNPQMDWAENDSNAATYIKNRLAYSTFEPMPEEENIVIKDAESFVAQTIPIKEVVGDSYTDLGLPAEIETYQALFSQQSLSMTNKMREKIYNSQGKYELIFKDLNNTYKFILKDATHNYFANDGIYVSSMGNPAMINAFCLMSNIPVSLPVGSNSTDDYAIGILYYEQEYGVIIFLGDITKYPLIDTTNNFSFILHEAIKENVFPIDKKYLVNTESDWNSMNPEDGGYIFNRPGDILQCEISPDSDMGYMGSVTLGTKNIEGFTIKYESVDNYLYLYVTPDEKRYFPAKEFKVVLNNDVYEHCPIFYKTSMIDVTAVELACIGNPKYLSDSYKELMSYDTGLSNAAEFKDNDLPFLIVLDLNSATPLSAATSYFENYTTGDRISIEIVPQTVVYGSTQVPKHILPGVVNAFIYNDDLLSVMTETAIESSGVASFAAGISAKATADSAVAIGNGAKATAKNAIAIGTTAEANGQNSISLGRYNRVSGSEAGALGGFGTATGQYSVCLNDHTNATGTGSLSINGYTTAAGTNSFALGKQTYAKGAQSIAGGETSVAGTTGSLAIGSNLRSSAEYCYNFGTLDFSGNAKALTKGTSFTITISPIPTASHDLDFITEYSFNGTAGKDWKTDIKSITYKDYPDTNQRIYTITTQANNGTSTTEKTVYYRKPGFIDQESRMAFSCGKGNEIRNSYYASAFGERIKIDSAQSQFAIGKYNLPESDKAFIIGNGVDRDNRSNALTVDWDGNIEATSLILTSPNGTKFKISVNDDGTLNTAQV